MNTHGLPISDEASAPSASLPLDRSRMPALADAVERVWADMGISGQRRLSADEALDAITTLVNATAGGGARYSVRVDTGYGSTAYTDLRTHTVRITGAPLYDDRLSVLEGLGVMAGMSFHEAGHGRLSKPMQTAVQKALNNATLGQSLPHDLIFRLSNILDDIRLEARNAARWPAYADVATLTLWWVAQRFPTGTISRLPGGMDEGVNFVVAATRYAPWTVWAGADVTAEREWWVEWAQRGIADDKPKTHVAALVEAEARLAHLPRLAPEAQDAPGAFGEAGDQAGQPQPGETDEQDEPLDADGLSGSSAGEPADEGDESDAASEGNAPGEGSDEADEADDLESDGDAAAGGFGDEATGEGFGDDTVYHHREGDADAASVSAGTVGEGGSEDITYGDSGVTDLAERGEDTGLAQRDGLRTALPLHGTDAADSDDRNMDTAVQRARDTSAMLQSREVVNVTHADGEEVAVRVYPLDTRRTKIDTDAQARSAIRAAFTSRKVRKDNKRITNSGSKVSGRHLYRAAVGNPSFYSRRGQPSPDSLDVTLLVDCSGSMAGDRLERAAQMAATMAEALLGLPRVRVRVVGHNTAYGTTLYDAFDSRKGEAVGRVAGLTSDAANNDASAISAMGARIVKDRSDRETSVLVVLSDGAPCEDEQWVRDAVESLRKQSVGVVSVAVAGGLTNTQTACYGHDWVVEWNNDWSRLSREVAVMLGRLA